VIQQRSKGAFSRREWLLTDAVLPALVVLVVISGLLTGCGAATLDEVRLDSGPVTGVQEEVDGQDIWIFKGIPYAAPPVGDLRWQPPQPVTPWEDPLPCTAFGPACPQPSMFEILDLITLDAGREDEDCLYLNVWSPADRAGEDLPVMVWIHGGSFETGSGSMALYDGRYLAARGVVVVTINYRLGALGFLVHPALSAASDEGVSGNYGLLDQIAALRWVRTNIAGFGGDADNVTVFGESAGAMSILTLLVMPEAEGLFRRAIVESGIMLDQGYGMPTTATVAQAEAAGEDMARRLGVDPAGDVAAQLRAKTPDELIEAAQQVSNESGTMERILLWRPVADGRHLPDLPTRLWAAGKQHRVSLLIGSNADEAELFLAGTIVTQAEFDAYADTIFGGYKDEALMLYPSAAAGDVTHALSRMLTEIGFASTARFAARAMSAASEVGVDGGLPGSGTAPSTYLYEFTRVPFSNPMGAFHAVEIPYVFGTTRLFSLPGIVQESDRRLSDVIMGYWTRFAATGDPNGDDAPVWPAYDKETDQHLELGDDIVVGAGLYEKACDLADRIRRLE
jgi:para-nitrobenzyl esterase